VYAEMVKDVTHRDAVLMASQSYVLTPLELPAEAVQGIVIADALEAVIKNYDAEPTICAVTTSIGTSTNGSPAELKLESRLCSSSVADRFGGRV
jgi:hypothetical protein